MNPLNIAAIVGLVLVLAFAVVLIQPENSAISQNDNSEITSSDISDSKSHGVDHDAMMAKHHSMINSLSQTEHIISVTGIAQTTVTPDLLVIEFGVETNGDSAKSVLDLNSNLLSKSISNLKSLGISEDNLSTSQFSINPLYDYYQDKETGRHTSELIGYQVSNILLVKTDQLDSAAEILDSAVSSGVNKVNSVQFTLSPHSHSVLKDSLIEDAINNAKSKAEIALLPLNQKIIGVQSISLNDFSIPSPMMRTAFVDESMFGGTPVFSSENIISTSVNVVFLISDK
ncbi:MAG: hypothetical protein MAG458_01409 [Nitrosopumilus sp.]|nr:hypothetical protein [Nitrosopumilus sp.]